MELSFYGNGKDTRGAAYGVAELFKMHTDGDVRTRWERCRQTLGQFGASSDEYRNAKLMMPAVTNAGVFAPSERKDTGLQVPSGLVQIEVDKLQDKRTRNAVIKKWSDNEATLWCAKSISWEGVFAFVKVDPAPTDAQSYKAAYASVKEVYTQGLPKGVELDDTVNNISRLRFLGHDPDAHLNLKCSALPVGKPLPVVVEDKKRTTDWRSTAMIEEGGRNSALAARAGAFVSSPSRPSIEKAQEYVREQNEKYCNPPLSLTDLDGLLHTSIPAWVGKRDNTIWVVNDKGNIRSNNQQNAYLAIQEMGYSVQRNEFANAVTVDGETYTEDMLKSMAVNISRNYAAHGYSPSNSMIDTAVVALANDNTINPQRDWLMSLEYCGGFEQTEICTQLGVADTELNFEVFKLLLRGMVSRVFQPGCKYDYMPVIIGKQGVGKSSLMSILAGEDLHTDSFSMNSYDTRKSLVEQARSKWLIEFQEFGALRGDKIEDLKGLISSTEDNIRLPYGRAATQIKRTFVLVATTNSQSLFADTHNRRHPVLQIEDDSAIELYYFKLMRDKLFAWIIHDYNPPEAHITLPERLWEVAEQNTQRFRHTTSFFEYAEEFHELCRIEGKSWVKSLDVQRQIKSARMIIPDKQFSRDMQAVGFSKRDLRSVYGDKRRGQTRVWVTNDFSAGHQQQSGRNARSILEKVFPIPL